MNVQFFKLFKVSILSEKGNHGSGCDLIFQAKEQVLKQEDWFLKPALPWPTVKLRERHLTQFISKLR